MDLPHVPPALVVESLHDLARINHRFGGIRAVQKPLMGQIRRAPVHSPIRILDLGTGSADIPRALVCWAQSEGLQIAITAVDVNPVMCELARKECLEFPQITIDRHNLLSLPYEARSFDFVTSSQVLHHFAEPDVVRILQQANRIARHGVVMADLRRGHVTYAAVWALTRLISRNPLIRLDGPTSTLNAFTPHELTELAHKAGLRQFRIYRQRFFRMTLVSSR